MVETSILVETILKLDKKPHASLSKIHDDVNEFVKKTHPDLIKNDKMVTRYKATDASIVDAYKNVMHVMLLNEIPGFKNNDDLIRVDNLIEGIHKKFDLPADLETINEVRRQMQKIIDKHCGVSINNTGRSF